jgi:hypothetical protein
MKKSMKKIIVLSTIVAGILVFWLAPGINAAKDVVYVRKYEDTDQKKDVSPAYENEVKALTKLETKGDTAQKTEQKIYKREKIRGGSSVKELDPSMFSRAVQFEEIPDSMNIELVDVDSTIVQ